MTTPGEFYDWLRTANPHLPPSNTVIGSTPAELTFGPDTMTTITITVLVDLPDVGPS